MFVNVHACVYHLCHKNCTANTGWDWLLQKVEMRFRVRVCEFLIYSICNSSFKTCKKLGVHLYQTSWLQKFKIY